MTADTEALRALQGQITPTMDGLRRIRAESWGIDMPRDGAWSFVGKRDDRPRLIIIETGVGETADRRHDAIERLCIMAPDLLAEVIRLRAEVERMRWQPIETGPKDGTTIVAMRDEDGHRGWSLIFWDDNFGWCGTTAENERIMAKFQPTHWFWIAAAPEVQP